MLGINKLQQLERVTLNEIRRMLGCLETPAESLMASRLRWLGHLKRMEDHCLPKKIMHGWLLPPRPPRGVKLRWRDKVMQDVNCKDWSK